jgi:hypothetical protein
MNSASWLSQSVHPSTWGARCASVAKSPCATMSCFTVPLFSGSSDKRTTVSQSSGRTTRHTTRHTTRLSHAAAATARVASEPALP